MRKILTIASMMGLLATTVAAQTTVTARAGIDDSTYRFVEVIHQYDNGTLAGAGYIDQGDPRDFTNLGDQQEVYAGGGYAFNIAGVNILAIGFVDRTTGEAAQTSVVPWVVAGRQLGRAIASGNYLAYTPADGDGEVVQILENAKVEYPIGSKWLAGVGYAATKVGDGDWLDKPFLTTTYRAELGDFEVWAQRPDTGDGVSFQLRFTRSFGE